MWVFIDPSTNTIECREDCLYKEIVSLLGGDLSNGCEVDHVTQDFSVIYNSTSDRERNLVIFGVESELCGGPYEGPAKYGPVAVVGSSTTLWNDYLPLTVESADTIFQFAQDA